MDIKEIVKEAVVVSELATFAEALTAMEQRHTNTLLVTNEAGELTGELTVADLLNAIVPDNLNGDDAIRTLATDTGLKKAIKNALDIPISECMSYDYTPLQMNDNMVSVISSAMFNGRSRIPVVDADNRPIGIISRQGLKHIIRKFAEV